MTGFTPISIDEQKTFNGRVFPLVYGPNTSDASVANLRTWVHEHRPELIKQAEVHGAVLFRGFDVVNPVEFADFIDAIGAKPMPYVGGAAVRRNIVGDTVFTANESPPSEPIPFHHEMAQVPNPPSHIFFYCDVEAKEGGETPIILSNLVFEHFQKNHPDFCAKVEKLGVRYVRILPEEDDPTSAIGRSWKSTFLVQTKEEVEAKMKELGTEWEWMENGNLKTITKVVPAVRLDERSGKKMFYNSMVAAYLGWIDSRNDPKKAIMLGDGSEVDTSALENVANFMKENRVCFKWRKGDILLVDNTVTMHARETFSPPRRILAAIGRGVEEKASSLSEACWTVRLPNGRRMPMVGFGTWKLPKEETAQLVYDAIRVGYRHIDCACDYGNEKEVGQGIKKAIEEGLVTRKDLWVTSKLWNTYHRKEHVLPACQRTLNDLQLDYLDLYLIHFPIALKYVPFDTRYPPEWIHDPAAAQPQMEEDNVPVIETWTAMEELVTSGGKGEEKGMCRAIGVSNFSVSLLRDLLNSCTIKPAVNQVELHPYLTQEKLLRYCKKSGVAVTGFSPLGAGSYVELGMAGNDDSALRNPVVTAMAARHNVTPAQVLLRWGAQRGTALIPKTSKVERMAENLGVFGSVEGSNPALSTEEMDEISALNQNRRFNDPGVFCEKAFSTFFPIYE
mmetsp:Transcript_36827/g.95372  ORF Transcript_36827/g.95372 Transcript_36827/m.95372 type:complete len:675 (-) Transcript_36827:23-2047(-)